MKRFPPRARKVLLALEMSNAAGRQQLVGIFRFLGAGIGWDVRINQPATELTAASARMVLQNRFDGIITALPCAESVRARLARANIPTVLLDIPYDGFPRATTSRLDIDDMEIAGNAARYFIQQNRFADFAFVGNDDGENWLKRRRQAFRRALLRLGHTAKYLSGSTPTEGGTHVAALAQGLAALAKPAAVFCANDTYAVHTLDACRRAGLAPGSSTSPRSSTLRRSRFSASTTMSTSATFPDRPSPASAPTSRTRASRPQTNSRGSWTAGIAGGYAASPFRRP